MYEHLLPWHMTVQAAQTRHRACVSGASSLSVHVAGSSGGRCFRRSRSGYTTPTHSRQTRRGNRRRRFGLPTGDSVSITLVKPQATLLNASARVPSGSSPLARRALSIRACSSSADASTYAIDILTAQQIFEAAHRLQADNTGGCWRQPAKTLIKALSNVVDCGNSELKYCQLPLSNDKVRANLWDVAAAWQVRQLHCFAEKAWPHKEARAGADVIRAACNWSAASLPPGWQLAALRPLICLGLLTSCCT